MTIVVAAILCLDIFDAVLLLRVSDDYYVSAWHFGCMSRASGHKVLMQMRFRFLPGLCQRQRVSFIGATCG
jgi:hypothetical protein